MGGNKRYAHADHAALVKELVAAVPDVTLDEPRSKLVDRAIVTTRTSIWRFLGPLAVTLKKRRFRGAAPGELPIERPSVFEFAINVKAAQALGGEVPLSLLVPAYEVIE
jgi:hypothetical protein